MLQFKKSNKVIFIIFAVILYLLINSINIYAIENPGRTSADYHSVPSAVISSIFPFWSGSWNTKFTGWGFAFVTIKTASTIFLIHSIATYDPDNYASNWTKESTVGNETQTSRVAVSELKVTFSAIILGLHIIADCVYSGVKTRFHNNYLQYGSNSTSMNYVSFFISPGLNSYNSTANKYNDSYDFTMAYHF